MPNEGLTVRELRQWSSIDRAHPDAYLKLSQLSVNDLRAAPPSGVHMEKIELPALSPQRTRLCAIVHGHTEADGICTHADLAHGLWEKEPEAMGTTVFDVQVCVINGILRRNGFRRRIKRLWGRGYQWVEETNADT